MLPQEDTSAVPELDRNEIDLAATLVRCMKSPGLDGLTGEMCLSILKAIPDFLDALLSNCVRSGDFSRSGKAAKVIVPLKSPNKVRRHY